MLGDKNYKIRVQGRGVKKIKQAGTELGTAQLKPGMDLTLIFS